MIDSFSEVPENISNIFCFVGKLFFFFIILVSYSQPLHNANLVAYPVINTLMFGMLRERDQNTDVYILDTAWIYFFLYLQ